MEIKKRQARKSLRPGRETVLTMRYELYNGKYIVEFSEAAHRYKVNGNYKQGVTGVLNILSKQGLIQWAANMVCDWIKQNCTDNGEFYEVLKTDLDQAKYAHARKKDTSADIGKAVHEWISDHIGGVDRLYTDEMKPSVEAFLRWEQANKPRYLHSEKVVYSVEYDYCGTFDVLFELNGKIYLADFKTSNPDGEWDHKSKRYTGRVRARGEHFLQCAAYDQALTEEFGKPVHAYMVIYVTKDGKLHTFEREDTEFLKETWLSLYKTFQLHKQLDFKNEFRKVER